MIAAARTALLSPSAGKPLLRVTSIRILSRENKTDLVKTRQREACGLGFCVGGNMHLQSATPDRGLAPFVRCFAQRETMPGSATSCQAIIGSLEQILSFDLGDRTLMRYPTGEAEFHARTYLMGSQRRYAGQVCLSGHVLAFGIFFRPFATWQLFGVPPA